MSKKDLYFVVKSHSWSQFIVAAEVYYERDISRCNGFINIQHCSLFLVKQRKNKDKTCP